MIASADALALRNLVYSAESGRYWEEHPGYLKTNERVDWVLLKNLSVSHRLLREASLSADAAQALLVQAMFIAYLDDRRIIGTEAFQGASSGEAHDFESLLDMNDIQSLERLFGTLRDDFQR